MRLFFLFVVGVCLFEVPARAGTPLEIPAADALQSFEDDVPPHIRAAKGRLSVSERYAQDGNFSLRWDWVPGDRLTIMTGSIGDIGVWTGYGNYSRSAIELKIYNEQRRDESLVFRWMAGDRQGGMFVYPLHIEGWQRISYHYSWKSGIKERNRANLLATDRIVVEAPATGVGGTVYLDALVVNKPFDFRNKQHPIVEVWQPYDIARYPHRELLAKPTAAELAAVARLLPKRRKDGRVAEGNVEKLEKHLRNKYNFRTLADGHLVGRSATWKELTPDMKRVADLWLRTGDDALATRLETLYFMLDDHFRTLGAVPQGSIGGLNNYVGRTHGDACFTMREPLLRSGRLERVRNTLKFNYNYAQIFEDGRASRSMDHHYNDVRYLFKIALMHETPEEIVKHLRVFKRSYDRQVIDTIKPDGSLYHHGAHYYAYAGGAMASTADSFLRVADTPFLPSREAFDAVKRALLNMRYYANVVDLPVTLHGRHPGRQSLNPSTFAKMAEAGRGYHDGRFDPELATAYLRLKPQDATKAIYVDEQITPEPPPHGNLAMNYAGLMGHRRGTWLAMVRGYGKYYWAQESYNNANRHGLFFGNGCLDILATGEPVNLLDSGCVVEKGWDWRYFDGSTAIHMPYKQMANGNGTMSERSDVGFIGGLSHRGRNGVFVMPLRSSHQYRKAMDENQQPAKGELFEADKSYFFFDNRIVCLGAGIRAKDVQHLVRTTLFQKYLKTTGTPIQIDGKDVVELPHKSVLATELPHTLMDIQHTGYVVPEGQSVHVVRQHQTSRNGHDNKDTEGDYATAWIEHGTSPDDGAYEYMLLVKTTPEQLAAFAVAMQGSEKQRPVRILRKDATAHIVHDAQTRSTGYVFFKETQIEVAPDTIIIGVSHPCLAMLLDAGAGRLQLGLCDPDLHLENGLSQPMTLTVTLSGHWTICEGDASARVTDNGNTRVSLTCHEGRSYDLLLEKGRM